MVHTIQRAVSLHNKLLELYMNRTFIELKGVGIGEYFYGNGKIHSLLFSPICLIVFQEVFSRQSNQLSHRPFLQLWLRQNLSLSSPPPPIHLCLPPILGLSKLSRNHHMPFYFKKVLTLIQFLFIALSLLTWGLLIILLSLQSGDGLRRSSVPSSSL